jgi:hypothetical protein
VYFLETYKELAGNAWMYNAMLTTFGFSLSLSRGNINKTLETSTFWKNDAFNGCVL